MVTVALPGAPLAPPDSSVRSPVAPIVCPLPPFPTVRLALASAMKVALPSTATRPGPTGKKVVGGPDGIWPSGWPRKELGRAACRERGLSVRVDFGGRRVMKQKNNKQRISLIKI